MNDILTARAPLPTTPPPSRGLSARRHSTTPNRLTRSDPARGMFGRVRAAPVRVRSFCSTRRTVSHRITLIVTQSLVANKTTTTTTTLNMKACIGVGWRRAYLPRMILRPAPMFWPAWEAPLFWPAWRPMMVWPALSCSSLKSRLDSSAGLGPSLGPVHSGCL